MVTVTEKRPRVRNTAAKPSSGFASASKIKAKILNTSSFFKSSLKGNNKALAKALELQSEKTRQLTEEVVLLRKRILALHFDLANQRHQKKELFAVIQNVYNTSIKSLDKATNLINDENEIFAEDADVDHANDAVEMEMFGSFLSHDKPPEDSKLASRRASQLTVKQDLRPPLDLRKSINSVASSDCLLPMRLSNKQPTNLEEEAVHQQTLVCSTEMDMTTVTTVAPIETVETKTSKSRCGDKGITGKDEVPGYSTSNTEHPFNTGLGEANGRTEVTEKASAAVVHTVTQGTSPELQLSIQVANTDVEYTLEPDDVPRRKTHFTKRRNRLTLDSHKGTENLSQISDPRKTYIISQKPFTDRLPKKEDGYSVHCGFGGIGENNLSEVYSTERQHDMKADVLPQRQRKNSVSRRTYIVSDRAGFEKSRMSDLSVITGQKTDYVSVMESTYEVQHDQIPIEPAEMRNTNTNKKPKMTDLLSATHQETRIQRREKSTLRGGIRVSTEERKSYFEEWSDFFAGDDQQKASIRVISAHENQTTSADVSTEPLTNSDESVAPPTVPSEHPVVVKPWKISDFLADGEQVISKKSKKANKGKSKEKKFLQLKKTKGAFQEKRQGHLPKRKQCGEDLVLDEHDPSSFVNKSQISDAQHFQDVVDNHNGLEVQHQSSEVHASTESCYPPKNSEAIHFRSESAISIDQSVCDKENSFTEEIIPTTNKASLKPILSETFVYPMNLNESQALLTGERPPWESLDFGCASPFSVSTPASSPPSVQPSKNMEIYQEASPTKTDLIPESRPMKTLTNTNYMTDVGTCRSRRKGATVSYKEPSLNLKMRRGDKFSDTQFLNSPVCKVKRVKKKHKA